jgi:hypothetical protein
MGYKLITTNIANCHPTNFNYTLENRSWKIGVAWSFMDA